MTNNLHTFRFLFSFFLLVLAGVHLGPFGHTFEL